MLHSNRKRRVATGGRATTWRRYHVALLLLLLQCLAASSATTTGAAGTGQESGLLVPSFFNIVGSGGSSVGAQRRAAASGDHDKVRAVGTESRRRRGESSSTKVTTATGVSSVTDGWEERGKKMMQGLRGGSEGLKSKKWIEDEAAKGLAARHVDGATVDQRGANGAGPHHAGSEYSVAGSGAAAGALGGPSIPPPPPPPPSTVARDKAGTLPSTGVDGHLAAQGLGESGSSRPESRMGMETQGDESSTPPEMGSRAGDGGTQGATELPGASTGRGSNGSGAGASTRVDYNNNAHLPRAGAPPPPRGEVRVRRPWGRHGAAAAPAGVPSVSEAFRRDTSGDPGRGVEGAAATPPGTATPENFPSVEDTGRGNSEGGGAGVGGTTPAGWVAEPAAGSEQASAPGGGASGAAGVGGEEGKVRKMKWQPKYLTVKAVFFLFYSSLGALMPYLPVYYHALGIGDRRIGHLGAITPAMTFLFTPLWGALTDKTGRLKEILVLTFAASTLLRVSLPSRTSFMWILSVVTVTAIINAPVRPLLDSSALQSLDNRAEYGKQRLWGQWGFGIGSFLTGKFLNRFGFKAAFCMHAAFSVPTLLILLRFSPKKEAKGKAPPKFAELYRLVTHDPDVLVFFTMVFAIGLSSGVIENFAYKRLRELGGTGSVLGVSRLVSSLSGIPMFFFSGAIVKHFSMVSILTASMMSFIARFVIYACVKNPWAGLPAEALRGITFAGFWAASTCHVGAIAPEGLSTTMLGLLNATYGGIGQSLGSLIGGSLSMRYGTARAFLVYAGVDTCLLFAFFLFWVLHPNGQQKDRGTSGGIGASSGGGRSARTAPPLALPPALTAAGLPVKNQTFSAPPPLPPPPPPPQSPSSGGDQR